MKKARRRQSVPVEFGFSRGMLGSHAGHGKNSAGDEGLFTSSDVIT